MGRNESFSCSSPLKKVEVAGLSSCILRKEQEFPQECYERPRPTGKASPQRAIESR